MKTYYLIRTVSRATPENRNFAGQTNVYYYGKGDELVAAFCNDPYVARDFCPYWVEDYGYTRRSDAARNWSYRNPENTKFWTSEAEIVEVHI